MGKRWDWAGDLSFIEWLAELIGVRVGIAPSEEDLQQIIKRNDHLLPDNAKQKVALELLGRSALEAFGLEGAMHALKRPVILGIQDKVGDYSLAVQAMAFVAGQIFGQPHGEDFAGLGREAAYVVFPPLNIGEKRAAEIIAEAATLYGEFERNAVAVALDEIAFRDARNVILLGEQRTWNDVLDLSDLFLSESVAASYGKFFDQRFVNYLAVNFEEIGTVNWRKFEALIAEYFHRNGFEVQLGAGRNDNGVDIRAWETGVNSETSPPTLIIQCKREKRKIGKVVIKALAADVHWEGAQQGLLAATVDWSPGAREVVKTRKYPVAEVNRSTLQRWLVEMRDSEKGLWLPR
ncbi:restriction endonuclease [Streptomyces griseorubiginosus]|uniref:restriction endonuclease n=1 Tax=Streptomyces griseorubiginosus TaxID=67304 RepID=UPI0036614531